MPLLGRVRLGLILTTTINMIACSSGRCQPLPWGGYSGECGYYWTIRRHQLR